MNKRIYIITCILKYKRKKEDHVSRFELDKISDLDNSKL